MIAFIAEVNEEQDYNCGCDRLISLHASPEGARRACEEDFAQVRAERRRRRSCVLVWREIETPSGAVSWRSHAEGSDYYTVYQSEVLP